jgi:hypothetical protein
VKAALDGRLPSPHVVTVEGPNGLDVAIDHRWSIHPWYVPVSARLRVEFVGGVGDTELQVEPARIDVSNGVGRFKVRGLLRRRVSRLLRTGTPELRAGPQRNLEDGRTANFW